MIVWHTTWTVGISSSCRTKPKRIENYCSNLKNRQNEKTRKRERERVDSQGTPTIISWRPKSEQVKSDYRSGWRLPLHTILMMIKRGASLWWPRLVKMVASLTIGEDRILSVDQIRQDSKREKGKIISWLGSDVRNSLSTKWKSPIGSVFSRLAKKQTDRHFDESAWTASLQPRGATCTTQPIAQRWKPELSLAGIYQVCFSLV